jgi:ParB-like chromosome segregation protein Spo0J
VEKKVYKELKRDIRLNGVLDPILYIETPDKEKIVIEGHTRLKACIDLKKKNIPSKKISEKFTDLDEIKL